MGTADQCSCEAFAHVLTNISTSCFTTTDDAFICVQHGSSWVLAHSSYNQTTCYQHLASNINSLLQTDGESASSVGCNSAGMVTVEVNTSGCVDQEGYTSFCALFANSQSCNTTFTQALCPKTCGTCSTTGIGECAAIARTLTTYSSKS